ncbi:MAG: hypothetical protein AUH78_20605 [Gemmatimonadetes bacterium 13_1_40CM_4_69_8]|uniref:DUF5050 domain-containing protein n=1 Tax=Candidatus Segetimicrobium genomatis TaxID=2569760 RepID=A0A537IS80_9BACT|nr:MAG: hypothetical protein AUH78_20605 [Gemmatimonadetes bacterium 13_1_40CM_4_69_8]TMI73902.1 MAG: hypothetical protein E6H05_08580 [Terrabacteria group bacterium ANGP1]
MYHIRLALAVRPGNALKQGLVVTVGALLFAACGKDATAPVAVSGPELAFLSLRTGDLSLWVANGDGSSATRVADVRSADLSFSWSPDGQNIAFEGGSDATSYGIYVVNVDGTHLRLLTASSNLTWGLAWSPDGAKIAFAKWYEGLFVMNADGTGQVNLASDFYNTSPGESPAWSPDGRRIAFTGMDGGWPDIYVVNANGSGRTRVTYGQHGCPVPEENSVPAWSPDGTTIAYEHRTCQATYEIHGINVDGTREVNLTSNQPSGLYPTWSPDGAQIAFWSFHDGGPYEIYVMNADGSSPVPITIGADYDACRHMSWSPDGTQLAYCVTPTDQGSSNVEVYAVGVHGTGTGDLSNHPAVDLSPVWRPKK